MNSDNLFMQVYSLVMRLGGLGIGADLYALTTIELWALYAFLRRLASD